jgi:hypothetical protein
MHTTWIKSPELQGSRSGNRLQTRVQTGRGSLQHPAACVYLVRADFRERVKKGPENRISVVADKAAARGANSPMTDPSGSAACWRQAGTLSSGCLPARSASATVARASRARATVPSSRCPAHGRPVPRAVPLFVRGGYWAVSTRGSGPGVNAVPAWGGADLTSRGEVRVDACGPGREASPPRRPTAGGIVPSATVRDPAPGPAGLPLRQDQAARPRPHDPSSFPVSSRHQAAVRRGRLGGGRT